MPTVAELFDLALRHHESGQLAQAELLCRQILQVDPAQQAVYHLLGILSFKFGRWQEAIAFIRQAIELNPDIAGFHYNLGLVYESQAQWAEAAQCFQQALRIDANNASAHHKLSVAFFQQGKIAEAAECYRQAICCDPNYLDAHNNLGLVLVEQRQLADAAECYSQALHIDPGNQAVLLNRSLLRLLEGNFEESWPDYEMRRAAPGISERPFTQPRWDGSPLEGRTILVYAEQGMGDTIMFARYLRLVKERGGRVVLECQPALVRLLADIPGADQLVSAGTTLPPFDVQISLLSLPGLFGTTIAGIPADIPYLRVDPERIEHWRRELQAVPGFKIGIAWQGQPSNSVDRCRSIPLTYFEALAKIEGVRLVSLQKGPGTEQIGALRSQFPILDLGDSLDRDAPFLDTAAVLVNLDLVVSVDSAVAHMAGAMGVPVWVALRFASDWRWLLERADSPWYPTMRLFRQRESGDWEEVFERIAESVFRP